MQEDPSTRSVEGSSTFGDMAYHLDRNTSSPSTTWTAKPDRMRGSRREGQQNVAAGGRWRKLRRRNPKDPLTIQVRYRGGSEAWWYVEARGSSGAFPGHMALHDVMNEINNSMHGS